MRCAATLFVGFAVLLLDCSAISSHRQQAVQYAGHQAKLKIAGGSDVMVYSTNLLDDQALITVGRAAQVAVQKQNNNKPCSCFCYFTAIGSTDPKVPLADTSCTCIEKGGIEVVKEEEAVPQTKVEAPVLPGPNTTVAAAAPPPPPEERYRYNYPPSAEHKMATDGLVISLDAGDKRSLQQNESGLQLKDVSRTGHAIDMEIEGNVTFQNDFGGGSLRFGATGDGDRVAVKGFDISPYVNGTVTQRSLTIEIWIQLHSIANDRGWVVGNDASTSHFAGRSLIMHDSRFKGPEVAVQSWEDAATSGGGAMAMAVEEPYLSKIGSPPINQWLHVVGVWNQERFSYMYKNGEQEVTSSITQNGRGLKRLVIGSHPTSAGYHVDASIAMVNVYSRALTMAEVESNFCFMARRFLMTCNDWVGSRMH